MIKEIDVSELAHWRQEGKEFVLLDVREPDEIASASIPESQNIPMGEIPQRLGELPREVPIAVLCHHGGRSERVAHFLAAQGFAEVANVEGGIDAYSRQIDSTIPTY